MRYLATVCGVVLMLLSNVVAEDCATAGQQLASARRVSNLQQREQTLRQVVAQCPSLLDARYELGLCLFEQGEELNKLASGLGGENGKGRAKHEEALAVFREGAKLREDKRVQLAQGRANLALGRYLEAEQEYQKVLARQAQQRQALQGLAVVYFQQKRYSDAEALLRRALQHYPDDAELFLNLGVVLEASGKRDEAIGSYKASLERKSSSALTAWYLARALYQSKRLPEAEEFIKSAVQYETKSVDIWLTYAAVMEAIGAREVAFQALDTAKKLGEKQEEVALNQAILWSQAGREGDALTLVDKLASSYPQYASAHSVRGWILLRQGDLKRAEGALLRALELNERDAFAHNNLGVLLERRGDTAGARREFNRARQLDSALAAAEANLQRVGENQ